MAPIRILYEDPYLVLCVKPVGVLSEDSPSGACMPGLLREHYRALGQNDYIATVHRLDRLVGGVMLFSRPVVHAAGADTPHHRQAHRRCLSPAGCLALEFVCMKKDRLRRSFLLCNAQRIKAVRCSYMTLYASKCPIPTNRHPTPKKNVRMAVAYSQNRPAPSLG